MSVLLLLVAYLIGGVTFLPLAVLAFFYLHPKQQPQPPEEEPLRAGEIEESGQTGLSLFKRGWITVTHEYLESTGEITSATQSVLDLQEGKSAYATLYKLVKNKAGKSFSGGSEDAIDSAQALGPASTPVVGPAKTTASGKKHRYYAVLKHGNLFLYKNEKMVDVKHVIVLYNHVVALWPRNLSESALFTKYSLIAIIRKDWLRTRRLLDDHADVGWRDDKKITIHDVLDPGLKLPAPPGTFFIYSDVNFDKEDWYYALIRATKSDDTGKFLSGLLAQSVLTGNTDNQTDPNVYAKSLHFDTENMVDLIQSLYSSEGQLQTKWFNALVGRLFLLFQKTDVMRNYLINRIERKLNKIKTPDFLDKFQITKVTSGKSAPFITYPVLKEINPEGDVLIAWYFHYFGGMSVQLATKVNINLGSRFKTREMDVLLSMKLEKILGPMLVRIKPPPSARIWYTFEHEPAMLVKIEPIISSRQMSYNIITSSIEKKLKVAVKESLVLPHWDDVVFFDTSSEFYRGGIWDKTVREPSDDTETKADPEVPPEEEPPAEPELAFEAIDESSVSTISSGPESVLSKKPKLKLASTISDLSNRLRKAKSTHTVGFDETNCLADGTVVESPPRRGSFASEALLSPVPNSTNSRKGSWSTENSLENKGYRPPEMITNRRQRKHSSPSHPTDANSTSDSTKVGGTSYDFGSVSSEPGILPKVDPVPKPSISLETVVPRELRSEHSAVSLSDAHPGPDQFPIKRSSTTRKPPPSLDDSLAKSFTA